MNQSYDPTFPFPPEDMVTPRIPQLAMTIILHLVALGFVVFGIYEFRTMKSPTLLLYVIGGYLSSFMEPIVDVNVMCYFPSKGQIVGMRSYGRDIPLYVLPVYAWFIGGQGYLFEKSFRSGRLTKPKLVSMCLSIWLVNLILELPMLAMKLYLYYGPAPFKLLGFPMYWAIVNMTSPLSAGFLGYILSPFLQGWKQLFIILIIPMEVGFGNLSMGWPMWWAMNSDYGYAATYPAFFATLGLACSVIYVISGYLPDKTKWNGSDGERTPLIR